MRKRKLGRTGLDVSPIAIGGSAFTYAQPSLNWDPYSADGKRIVLKMINECLDLGINYADTAPAYGDGYSERLFGEVMATRRADCVLASKVWFESTHDEVFASVHASLERLNTDHIDIMQLHGRIYTPAQVDTIVNGGALDALLELREQGKIGHIGITTEEPWSALPFLACPAIEVYQIAYNFIYQAAARHFLIQASEADAGIVSMRTMTSGILQLEARFLAPHWRAEELYEIALKFVLSDSRVHSGIVGMRNPQEALRNAAIVNGWEPPCDFAEMPRLTSDVLKTDQPA